MTGIACAADKTESDAIEFAAARLAAATVTVRILPEKAVNNQKLLAQGQRAAGPAADNQADQAELYEGVTVCSGVSVAPGEIVTFASNGANQTLSNARFRVTLPDGEQSKAHLRVVDNYSGLSLLDIEEKKLPVLEIATERPKVGSRVLTAAAGGIEGPTVSLGIAAGSNRLIGSNILPPLLPCDVRTTEASSGAGVVDQSAKLVGILVAAPVPGEPGGWAYAVPSHHVQRLIDARADDKLLILERRQPTLGLTIGAGAKEGTVEVERVTPGGPADTKGVRKRDLILQADGYNIRSADQAIYMVLNHQAGDKVNFLLQRGDERKSVDITLGGSSVGASVSNSATPEQQLQQQQGRVTIRRRGDTYEVIGNSGNLNSGANSSSAPAAPYAREPAAKSAAAGNASVNELATLKSQVTSLENSVKQLRHELRERSESPVDADARVKSLQDQISQLRKELGAKSQSAPSKPAEAKK